MSRTMNTNLRGGFHVIFLRCLCFTWWCVFLAVSRSAGGTQLPALTIRFMNPQYNCIGSTYCVDVALQSNTPQVRLFGANIRFFYDTAVLDFLAFGDFEAGYAAPNTPTVITGSPDSGPAMFGFTGPAAYINGPLQLMNTQAPPLYIATDGWTRLFRVYFTVEQAGEKDAAAFYPALVFDLKAIPSEGGFLGSNGLVMTVLSSPSKDSAPANERVVQFNWQYAELSAPPYGSPVNLTGADCGGVFPVPHPADVNADYYLPLPEAIAYLAGWQQGGNPLGHAIRAAYLWQNGEHYAYDPENTAPSCWVLF